MTVLISQVNRMRHLGHDIQTVICASTGDTSAALAAFGAAAKIPTVVLLPKGKISAAQLVQPLSHGARVIAIDTDFDGCMAHVQRLASEPGIYLANSKNSLRIEGQKTVAFEICQGLGWNIPDWVAIPGGNLGNVSALIRGFENLRDAGIINRLPRVICAQAAHANPLYRSFEKGFAPLEKMTAKPTQASAIRIGDPVSFPRAMMALKKVNGTVASITEQQLTDMAIEADITGFYLCPHTAVAMAAAIQHRQAGIIAAGERVVVVSTAHGLKFTEFKQATASNSVPGVTHTHTHTLVDVPNVYTRIRDAVLRETP
jgi:threonine synthase